MSRPSSSFDIPVKDQISDSAGVASAAWNSFFRGLYERIFPLGVERSFTIANNQASPADITALKVNARAVSQAIVEFLVQRVTTGGGAVELIESGSFILSYNPTAHDWNISLVTINVPDNSGVDFTVSADGQVKYTSSNVAGTASISKMFWRMRTLAGKNAQYSSQGTR